MTHCFSNYPMQIIVSITLVNAIDLVHWIYRSFLTSFLKINTIYHMKLVSMMLFELKDCVGIDLT